MPAEALLAFRLKQRAAGAVRAGRVTLDRYPRLIRVGVYLGRLGVQLWRKLLRDECLDRAAALAYTTVLALVPMLAVMFLVFRMSASFAPAEDAVRQFLFQSLLANSITQAVGYLNTFLTNVGRGAVGITGTAMLIFSATWLFITIETTLNRIFHVYEQRRLFSRFTTFWSLMTLGPVLIALGIYLVASFNDSGVGRFLGTAPVVGALLGVALPFLLTAVVLAVTYKLVPNTRVRFVPALVGGLVAGLLFGVSKLGFNFYVIQIYSGSYTTRVYGTFALFPLFLLWIYILWLVVLLGAVVTHTVQNLDVFYDEELRSRVDDETGRATISPYTACRLMLVLSYLHWAGRAPLSGPDLVRVLRVPDEVVYDALGRLTAGKLLRTLERDGEAVYLPARDVGNITVDEALRAYQASGLGPVHRTRGNAGGAGARGLPSAMLVLDDLFCDLSVQQREVAGDFTFLDLIEAVDADRFESFLSGGEPAVGPEAEVKRPPTPLSPATKSIDPDASAGNQKG
jgi:membrane protein